MCIVSTTLGLWKLLQSTADWFSPARKRAGQGLSRWQRGDPSQTRVCLGKDSIKGLTTPLEFLNSHPDSVIGPSFQWFLHHSSGLETCKWSTLSVYSPFSLQSFVFCAVTSFANWVTSSSFAFASFKRSSYRLQSFSALAYKLRRKGWTWFIESTLNELPGEGEERRFLGPLCSLRPESHGQRWEPSLLILNSAIHSASNP